MEFADRMYIIGLLELALTTNQSVHLQLVNQLVSLVFVFAIIRMSIDSIIGVSSDADRINDICEKC